MCMRNKPLISIIVPNYNYSEFLDGRFCSIFAQTYDNYEVIILDDCSSDDSLKVIDKYKDNKKVSKVIINEINSGSPFKQWEKGINNAAGEIIWIAESDDLCEPTFLETLVESYLLGDAVMAFCRSKLIDVHGDKLRENFQMSETKADICWEGLDFIKNILCLRNEVQNASSVIFSKSVACSVNKNFMSYKGAGDWLFWLEIAEKGNVCFVNRELNQYRLHQNTTSIVVKSGVEFREMKQIYHWLYEKGYLTDAQLKKCRIENLLLIDSIHDIPSGVKHSLFSMWNADWRTKMKMHVIKIYAWLRSSIFSFL